MADAKAQSREKALEVEPAHEGTVRVKMLSTQYMSEMPEHGNRLMAGTVLDVTPDVANRWVTRAGIAEYAPDEQTTRAQRVADLEAELARLREA